MATVGVIVVNWNGWRHTLACLGSLQKTKGAAWRLYVVDNASGDGSLDHLGGMGRDAVLIASPVNGGWTGGNNQGVQRALDDGCDYIFVLNNDAQVEPDTLAQLIAYHRARPLDNPVIGPIESDPVSGRLSFIGATDDPITGLPIHIHAEDLSLDLVPDVCETAFVKGSGIFAHRSVFEAVGLFDDRFYLNFDDTDWSYRARKAGFPLVMLKAARIRHLGSATIGGTKSPLQMYFLARNGLLFAEKHASFRQRVALAKPYVWAARDLPRHRPRRLWLLSFLLERDGAYPAYRKGIADYLLRRFGDCPAKVRRWNAEYRERWRAEGA